MAEGGRLELATPPRRIDGSIPEVLAAIRERDQRIWDQRGNVGGLLAITEARDDVPRLLSALEALLKLHQPDRIGIFGSLCRFHEPHRHFSITSVEAAGVQACGDCKATVYQSCSGCGPHVDIDQCHVHRSISRALLGEGGDPRG